MDYNMIVKKIDSFIGEHFDILCLLYPREFDCKYSMLIKCIKNGKPLVQLRKDIETFFKFQGMDEEERINLLKLFDANKEKIKSIKNGNIDNIFSLYNTLLEETKKITGKYQYVNTAKLMHVYNQNIPLFDNNVINFLKYMGVTIEHRTEKAYHHILNIYKIINEEKIIPTITKLKNKVYSDMEIDYINLNKFVDTLFYFINDSEKLKKYKSLCKKK